MSQEQKILAYCISGRKLSPGRALNELGIYALSQRFNEMRKDRRFNQYNFHSRWAKNGRARFKEYWITLKEPKQLELSEDQPWL